MQPLDLKKKARALRAEMTPAEARLWYQLRGKRFGGRKFVRQFIVGPYIVDFAARSHGLIVEIDGDTHGATAAYDERRTRVLEQHGYRVIRFANADVMTNISAVLETIAMAFDSPLSDPLPVGERERRLVTLAGEDDFDGWRAAARDLALAGVAAEDVSWRVGDAPGDLFAAAAAPPAPQQGGFSVPRPFVQLAETAILHSDPERFALLYALLLKVRAQPGMFEDRADPLIRRLDEFAKGVRRDIHKMRAFLRFREIEERFVAWFEPEHHIVRANAGFFVRRFASMRWSILTPALSVHWDGETLSEGPGATKADAPEGDPVEEVWKTYYASIFNPARLKTGAMLKEMPKKYWKNMPETALVPQLIATAQARESSMIETARAAPGGNRFAAWEALREEAAACTRCALYKHATQTVFGEGPVDAKLMFVGEQPGDQEDLAGRPFVGPAGQVFDRALAAAGVDRSIAYVTNAVKHFKYELRGKRRIHSKPGTVEIEACKWWIEQEAMLIQPDVTVALGATAARSLFGRTMTIGRERGRRLELADGGAAWITVHPSYLLRIDDKARADEEFERFVEDLKGAAALVT